MSKNKLIILNIVVPLLIGGMGYYFLAPEVQGIKVLSDFLHLESREPIIYNNLFIQLFRNYGLDMLWAYALIFSLFFIIGNNTASLHIILGVTIMFSVIIEFLQLTPVVEGTFDICDILVEGIAEVFAVFIIKNTFMRSVGNEKGT